MANSIQPITPQPNSQPAPLLTTLSAEEATGKRLVAEACARYYMTKKELAHALGIPVSAISGKRVAPPVQERLEAWLQQDHGALEGVEDMLEASQAALQEEHTKQIARHQRGLERSEKEMERMPIRYLKALHRLARLRKVIAALPNDDQDDLDDLGQLEELAHQENKLMNAVTRNNLGAQYRLRVKLRLHQEALEVLQEERDMYHLRQELAQYTAKGPLLLQGDVDGLDVLQENLDYMGITSEALQALEAPQPATAPSLANAAPSLNAVSAISTIAPQTPEPAKQPATTAPVAEETRQQRRKRERQEAKAAEKATKNQKSGVAKGGS